MAETVSFLHDVFERFLECPICLGRLTEPKELACQHTFCGSCLLQMVHELPEDAPIYIDCPECRQRTWPCGPHPVAKETAIRALPTNRKVQELLELKPLTRCELCTRDDGAGFQICAHCDKRVCKECCTEHADAVRRDYASREAGVAAGVTAAHEAVDTWGAMTLTMGATARREVHRTFDTLVQFLEQRRTNLVADIDVLEREAVLRHRDAMHRVASLSRRGREACHSTRKQLTPEDSSDLSSPHWRKDNLKAFDELKRDLDKMLADVTKEKKTIKTGLSQTPLIDRIKEFGHVRLADVISIDLTSLDTSDDVDIDVVTVESAAEGESVASGSGNHDYQPLNLSVKRPHPEYTRILADLYALQPAQYEANPQSAQYEANPQPAQYEANPQPAQYEANPQAAQYEANPQPAQYEANPHPELYNPQPAPKRRLACGTGHVAPQAPNPTVLL